MTTRRRLLANLCAVPLLASGCRSKKREIEVIDPADLDRIRVGDVVRLRDLLKRPAERVCQLRSYASRIDEKEPFSDRINAHLKAMGPYVPEGTHALIFVDDKKVRVQLFLLGRHRIQSWHEGAGRIASPLHCADVDRVIVTRVHDLWPTLVFGVER
ncbi:hypothetical protein [Reyranella sp.]|uniref:hypothetical protein n=1 Tax=Reyranella sp. TaxID=1929291 RepID=UPI003BADAA7D